MYKVGDKVRVTDPFYEGLYNTIREVVKVDGLYVYIEDGTSSPYPMKEHEIELVKEPEFKVGDKARVIGNKDPYHNFKIGEIVTIISGKNFNGNYDCEGEKFPQFVNPRDLELVKEEKMEEEILMPLYVGGGVAFMLNGQDVPRSYVSGVYNKHDILDMLENGNLGVVNKETPNPRVVRAAGAAKGWVQSIVIIRAMTGCGLKEAKEFYDNHVTLT